MKIRVSVGIIFILSILLLICGMSVSADITWYDESFGGSAVVTATELSPVFSNPDPANKSTTVDIYQGFWNITINDPNGDTFNWTIESSPDVGNNSGFTDSNGTKNCSLSGLVVDTNYTVYVNATDLGSGNWTNETFWFITRSINTTWYNLSFGGSLSVIGWNNWSDWWNITFINVSPPSSFSCSNVNNNSINVSWVLGGNASNTTVVRKKGSNPSNISDGSNIYNGTGLFVVDTGLDVGSRYYYKAWSWNASTSSFSSDNSTCDCYTNPGNVTSLSNTSITNVTVNLSWTDGTNTSHTVVRYNDSAYPASPQTGANGANTTLSYANISGLSEETTYYMSVWGFNSTSGLFSDSNITMIVTTYGNNSPPTNFNVSVYNNSILNISWTSGVDADNTTITRKKNSVPTSPSDGDVVYNGTGSFYNDTGLDPGTNYSYKAWSWNNTYGLSSGNISNSSYTRPGDLSNFANNSPGYTSVVFTWTNGTNATNYTIRYSNYSYPSTPQSNESGYNGSGPSGSVTGLLDNTTYYFSIWGWVNPFTEGYETLNVTTLDASGDVDPPYDGDFDYSPISPYYLNLSWMRGNNSDSDIVRRKTTGYPVNHVDGTLVDNNTANLSGGRYYYNESGVTDFAYYTVFSWNQTNNTFSQTGEDIPWGALVIWAVYNESNMSQSIGYNIEITDKNATEVYTQLNVTDHLYIDFNDIPYGNDTVFLIYNASYKQRVYYYDLEINNFYNYTFYLPPHYTSVENGSGDDGGNTTETQLYLLSVVGPQNEYTSPPVEGATIEIRRYNNVTDTYVTVTTVVTDANGQVEVYLVPFNLYKVNITKDGYDPTVSEYIPGTDIYTKTFRIVPSVIEPPEYDIFWDNISFNGTMYLNESIRIVYSDDNSSTINTTCCLYDVYNGSFSLVDTYNDTNSSWTHWVSSINTSHPYEAWLWFNNTADYASVTSPVSISIMPVNGTWGHDIDLEDRFSNVFGDFTLGYANFFAILLPLVMLMIFGPFNVGGGIIACGFTLGLMQMLYAAFGIGFNALLIALCPICLIFGFMYIRVKGGDHL